jgi:plasmid maintenance system antidote protein VapI
MKRKLPVWSKEVKKALIDRDMNASDLARGIQMSRCYVNQVINATQYAPEIADRISEYLDIKVPYCENII